MNKSSSLYLLLVLLPALLLFSCDHRVLDPNPLGQFRLKRVSYNGRSVNGADLQPRAYELTYNLNGALLSYSFSFTQGNGLFFSEYAVSSDAQGRPVRVTPSSPDFRGQFLTYEYSSANRISQVRTLNRTINPIDRTTTIDLLLRRYGYVYDTPDGLLPVHRGYLESQVVINNAEEEYTFVNGNAVTVNQTNYTYDDKPNPYYGLLGFNAFNTFADNPQFIRPAGTPFNNSDYFADIQVKVFNRNNMTNNTRQITYNADGLVTRIEYTNGNVEEFTYEHKP